ncbi:prohead protease/major capsid protein fusion protein [Stenotrophomonas maltophilia]|uniref:prohead protease/major capsid protein fusion protein n=1 Tax=Stenotrophomonas maltophilia TaxID=40324 RepID=UPI001E616068|nr:prohead protease/major capsid protein fusion protein [Stenotrophomonas maltophilia]MCD5963218.1 peptidase S14 [Stenotrophomonas maltophilia]
MPQPIQALTQHGTTRLMPPQLREAELQPTSFDSEARTIELQWTAGTRVRRYDWWNDTYYWEELVVDEAACNMERLSSGAAPVLDSHNTWGIGSQMGVVDRAWLSNGAGHALIRLSGREELAGVIADIGAGIIRNISVGYTVQRYEIERAVNPGDLPIYRAVEWTPSEISFVTVPADPAAGTRSNQPAQGTPCVFTRSASSQEHTMPQPAARAAESAVQQEPINNTPAPVAPAAAQAPEGDTRAADIVELATRHGQTEHAAGWIRAGHSVDHVRGLILTTLEQRDAAAGGNINRISVTEDEQDLQRSAVTHALLHRAQVIDPATKRIFALAGDNPVRGLTLMDLARRSLERCGVRTDGMAKLELVGRAFTQSGSDFPVLLESTMHKALQAAYAVAPDTWSRWCVTGTVSDFREHSRYRVGSIGNLDKLTESGEFKNKKIPDGEKATITAGTKGNTINLTRQAIINDDLGAFLGLATAFGRAAKRTIEADAYAFLASNPKLDSNKTLFHADHGNILAAAVPSVASVDAMRVQLAQQKDVGGNDVLDLSPALWLGPTKYGSAARVTNKAEYDPDAEGKLQRPNAVQGLFRDIVDTARIKDDKWYLFADPNDCPAIEVAFLDGITEPFLDYEEGFTVDGVRWKARLDFGIAALDYRGVQRCG